MTGSCGAARTPPTLAASSYAPPPKGSRILTAGRRRRVQALTAGLAALSPEELAAIARGAELIERVTRGTDDRP